MTMIFCACCGLCGAVFGWVLGHHAGYHEGRQSMTPSTDAISSKLANEDPKAS